MAGCFKSTSLVRSLHRNCSLYISGLKNCLLVLKDYQLRSLDERPFGSRHPEDFPNELTASPYPNLVKHHCIIPKRSGVHLGSFKPRPSKYP